MGKSRVNATGRSEAGFFKGPFIGFEIAFLESAAYCALTPNARSLLVELYMMARLDVGLVYLSVVDAAARMGVRDPHTASKAFTELEQFGFLCEVQKGHFAVKAGDRRASVWRLTWLAGPKPGPASNEWKEVEPRAGTKERKRMIVRQTAIKNFKRERQVQNNSPVGNNHTAKAKPVRNFLASPPAGPPVIATTVGNNHTAGQNYDGKSTDPLNGKNHIHLELPSPQAPRADQTNHQSPLNIIGPHVANMFGAISRACEHCQQAFELGRSDRAKPRRYCTPRCQKAAESARAYQRKKDAC